MKPIHYLALMASALACAPVSAHDRSQDMTITARPLSVVQWSRSIGKQIDRKLQYPTPIMGRATEEGIVAIRFACSDSGTPANMVIQRTSGSRALDRAAMRAVTQINTLHPLPVTINRDQRFVAMIMFAASEDEHDRQVVAVNKYAQQQIALARQDPTQVAMFIGASAPAS